MNTKKYKYLFGLAFLLFTVCFFSSCSDDDDIKSDTAFYDNVKIKIKGLEEDILYVNYYTKPAIAVESDPEDIIFNMRGFNYQVADTNILKVDALGNITPVSLGTTEVTLLFRPNNKVTTTSKVCIWRDPVYISDIVIPDFNIKLGKTHDLTTTTTLIPNDADNKKLKYESLTPAVISVNDAGLVTTIGEGVGQVKVSTTEGTDVSTICTITVVGEVKVTDIELPAGLDGTSLIVGETLDLGAAEIKAIPDNADNPELKYEIVSGGDAITMDANKKITAIATGTVVIKISATDGSDVSRNLTLYVLCDRSNWTITTSVDYKYVPDGTTGMPEDILDGQGNTFLSMVKAGKSFTSGGVTYTTPANHVVHFIVDMKVAQKFSYFLWWHRNNHSTAGLRVQGVSIYGSNNGVDFTPIKTNIDLQTSSNSAPFKTAIPASEYRYVKVEYVKWDDSSGSTLQVAEFNLGG